MSLCPQFVACKVQRGETRHTTPEAVRVFASPALVHDVPAVVVAQASAQLLVIHSWFPLALAPQPRHLGRRQGSVGAEPGASEGWGRVRLGWGAGGAPRAGTGLERGSGAPRGRGVAPPPWDRTAGTRGCCLSSGCSCDAPCREVTPGGTATAEWDLQGGHR